MSWVDDYIAQIQATRVTTPQSNNVAEDITFAPEMEIQLLRLGVKERYVRNMKKQKSARQIKELQQMKNWADLINRGFIWNSTPEGHEYWQRLYRIELHLVE
jgi:hypothetical protein